MPDPVTLPQRRAEAENLYNLIKNFDAEIQADAQNGLPGYPEYASSNIAESLVKADELLKKDHYTMCVAGTFSAGKSTFINGMLNEPDLLPAAAGECTLSITVVQAPGPGENERVAIDYFTKEIAVNSIVEHQQKFRNAFKHWEKELAGAGVEAQVEVIKKVAAWLPTVQDDESLPADLREEFSKQKCADELAPMLKGFLDFLEKYASRLGRTHIDNDINNASGYLASEGDNKFYDIGHLLLIEKVTVFCNNRLFTEKGIQIVDTPGTDSANPRQRDITHAYLNQADVVVSVLEPRGFTMANMDIIAEMARANMGNIRNKMFFTINKFDMLSPDEFEGTKIAKYLDNEFKNKLLQEQLSPKHVYPTVALVDVLKAKGQEEQAKSVLESCKGRLNSISDDTPEPWKSRVRDALSGTGVANMRDVMIRYLEEELAFERIRDIQRHLAGPLAAAAAFIETNQGQIDLARSNRKSAFGRINDFIQESKQTFSGGISQLVQGCPIVIPERIIPGLKQQILTKVEEFKTWSLADASVQTQHMAILRNVREQRGDLTAPAIPPAPITAPAEIKRFWISYAKEVFCHTFISTFSTGIVGGLFGQVSARVEESNVEKILENISEQCDVDVVTPLRTAVATARQHMEIITDLRAEEETWAIRDRDIQPQGFESSWTTQIEQAFKEDIVRNFTAAFNSFIDKVGSILSQYYAVILKNLINDYHGAADEVADLLINSPTVDLPIHLLTGQAPDPQEELRRRLLFFADIVESAKLTDSELKVALS